MPTKKMENPLKEPVVDCPDRPKDRKPDQFTQLVCLDEYESRPGAPDGYDDARKQLFGEIRLVPTRDLNARIEGALSGRYDYVDALQVEVFDCLKSPKATKPVRMKPFGWPVRVNTMEESMGSQDARTTLRMALSMEDMLAAAFNNSDFVALNAAMYPNDHAWYSLTGTEGRYNVADPETAKALPNKADHDGKSLRILTSRQFRERSSLASTANASRRSTPSIPRVTLKSAWLCGTMSIRQYATRRRPSRSVTSTSSRRARPSSAAWFRHSVRISGSRRSSRCPIIETRDCAWKRRLFLPSFGG
jgi:hypothetical protein